MDQNFDLTRIKWIKDEYNNPTPYYKIKIPSVSTIINEEIPDPEYEKWVEEMGQEKVDQIMTAAGRRGSSMHIFIENFIIQYSKSKDVSEALRYTQEESPKILESEKIPNDKIEEGRNLFYKFYYSSYSNQYENIYMLEMPIYSPSLFYRGKLDIFYKDKIFGPSIVDLKSSNGKIKKDSIKDIKYKHQLSAYVIALEEMYKNKNLVINRASVLCVDKQSDVLQEIVCENDELKKYKESFETLLKNYHIRNNQQYLIKNKIN